MGAFLVLLIVHAAMLHLTVMLFSFSLLASLQLIVLPIAH